MATKANEIPTLEQILQNAIRKELLDVHTCLPAKIEKYDANTQKANVQILLKRKYEDDTEAVNLPVINSVPVQWVSANQGKAYIHLPLKAGDLGIVVFSERSIDLWLSGDPGEPGKILDPDDPRIFNLSDAIFIPGVLPFVHALQNVSADNLVVQNDQFRIEIDPSGKISLSGVNEELITIIDDLFTNLIVDARVLTIFGPQPFIADTITKLTAIRTRLREIKRV
jgi:hypothetical protein